jgi:hypothetical protein
LQLKAVVILNQVSLNYIVRADFMKKIRETFQHGKQLKIKWFMFGAISYQLLQIVIVFLTGKAATEWAIVIRGFL